VDEMTTNYNLVALLPMKANSERVKGKNFREFAGKPLFRWILDTLLKIDKINCVIINTDARHILEANGLTDSNRILIRDRKPELCGDHVSMNKVLNDDIQNIKSSTYVMTHTTNPLLSSDTIDQAIQSYIEGLLEGKDSLFTVNKYQTRFYREDTSPVNHDPNNLLRTQDLEPWYEENSNLYIFSKDSFVNANARIGANPILFETPTTESQDIDNKIDWQIAEIMALASMLARSQDKNFKS
jgi:CMP-N-acetylneuraminic acid synthetase